MYNILLELFFYLKNWFFGIVMFCWKIVDAILKSDQRDIGWSVHAKHAEDLAWSVVSDLVWKRFKKRLREDLQDIGYMQQILVRG